MSRIAGISLGIWLPLALGACGAGEPEETCAIAPGAGVSFDVAELTVVERGVRHGAADELKARLGG